MVEAILVKIFLLMMLFVITFPLMEDTYKWFIDEWKWLMGYLYDFGADLEGVKPVEELEDEEN